MARLATSLLAVLLASSGHAAVPYEQLRSVGDRVSCQCGCSYTVGSCNMLSCHFRDPILLQIREGLESGESEEAILEAVYAKYGSVTRVQPGRDGFGMVGWTIPFVSLVIGLTIVGFVIRRWRRGGQRRVRASSVPDTVVERYRRQIESDLEDLD